MAARAASVAAVALVVGTAGAAAATQGRLPSPMQSAARLVGLPTPSSRLEDAQQALAGLETVLRREDSTDTAIAAAAGQLRQRLGGLSPSDQARLGALSVLSVADDRLRGAGPTAGSNVASPGQPTGGTTRAAPPTTSTTGNDHGDGGKGGDGGASTGGGTSGGPGPSGGGTSGGGTNGGGTSGGGRSAGGGPRRQHKRRWRPRALLRGEGPDLGRRARFRSKRRLFGLFRSCGRWLGWRHSWCKPPASTSKFERFT